MQDDSISLTEAGILLGLDWHQAYRRMMRGDFGQPRKVSGRWLLPASTVSALAQRAKPATQSP